MKAIRRIIKTVAGVAAAFCMASAAAQSPGYRIETVAEGLSHPWSLAFLPDGSKLVTEREGRLRLIDAKGQLRPEPVDGVPHDYAAKQAGLMDVAVDPDFSFNQTIYLTHAYGTRRANNTRVARARLVDGQLVDVQTLFNAAPAKPGSSHYGGRIAFLSDGTLVLTLGDGFDQREAAQVPSSHLGKTVRLNRDGSVPRDNPFVNQPGFAPEVYTLGHRNVQGIVYDRDTKRLYIHEHGPRGGDELNLLEAGGNYGWPLATHGVDYTGARVSPHRALPGMRDALLVWTPSIAPSGMALYRGKQFPAWQGDLFISTLAEKGVRRVVMKDGRPTGEQQVLFTELDARIRDVRSGPDGALYLLTDGEDGKLLRVTPRQ